MKIFNKKSDEEKVEEEIISMVSEAGIYRGFRSSVHHEHI